MKCRFLLYYFLGQVGNLKTIWKKTPKSLIKNSLREKNRKFTGLFRLHNEFSLHGVPSLRSNSRSTAFKCATGCPVMRLLSTTNVPNIPNFKYISGKVVLQLTSSPCSCTTHNFPNPPHFVPLCMQGTCHNELQSCLSGSNSDHKSILSFL